MGGTTNYIYMPFPRDLYDLIIIRSAGRLDPAEIAADEVRNFVERNKYVKSIWSAAGIEEFIDDDLLEQAKIDAGDKSLGYQWQDIFLPNGTELRMSYKGEYYYALISHEKITYGDDQRFSSPSQFGSHVAGSTQRNAWRDIWIRFPGETGWVHALVLRNKNMK